MQFCEIQSYCDFTYKDKVALASYIIVLYLKCGAAICFYEKFVYSAMLNFVTFESAVTSHLFQMYNMSSLQIRVLDIINVGLVLLNLKQ